MIFGGELIRPPDAPVRPVLIQLSAILEAERAGPSVTSDVGIQKRSNSERRGRFSAVRLRKSARRVKGYRTTQAQRPGPRGRSIATWTRWPGSLQRKVRLHNVVQVEPKPNRKSTKSRMVRVRTSQPKPPTSDSALEEPRTKQYGRPPNRRTRALRCTATPPMRSSNNGKQRTVSESEIKRCR